MSNFIHAAINPVIHRCILSILGMVSSKLLEKTKRNKSIEVLRVRRAGGEVRRAAGRVEASKDYERSFPCAAKKDGAGQTRAGKSGCGDEGGFDRGRCERGCGEGEKGKAVMG